jgi:hypothetical protein
MDSFDLLVKGYQGRAAAGHRAGDATMLVWMHRCGAVACAELAENLRTKCSEVEQRPTNGTVGWLAGWLTHQAVLAGGRSMARLPLCEPRAPFSQTRSSKLRRCTTMRATRQAPRCSTVCLPRTAASPTTPNPRVDHNTR